MSDVKFYVSEKSQKFFHSWARKFKIRDDMQIHPVPHGFIAVNTKTKAYGVLDENGRFVKSCRCLRGKTGQFIPHLDKGEPVPYFDCDAVFCADTKQHFGHFLLEGMPRTYPALDKKYKNAKFVFVSRDGALAPSWIKPLMMGLGVPAENVLVLTSPAQFRNVFVPDQAFNIPYWSSPQIQKIYRKISTFWARKTTVPANKKIYVSRGAMPQRRIYGENKIAHVFAKNGFKVIYPETLPLEKQIAIVGKCSVLAGCAGTALHLSLFMKPGGKVIQIKRNSKTRDNCGVQNMINQTMNLDFTYIDASIESRPSEHFTPCPQIIGATKYLQDFWKDNGFKYTARDCEADMSELSEYQVALDQYNATHSGEFMERAKHKFVKILSCLVPGRVNRNRFRGWLKRKIGLKK